MNTSFKCICTQNRFITQMTGKLRRSGNSAQLVHVMMMMMMIVVVVVVVVVVYPLHIQIEQVKTGTQRGQRHTTQKREKWSVVSWLVGWSFDFD